MSALKIKYILFIAVLMFAAKPFVGFSVYDQIRLGTTAKIFVKAFTKRKQEFIEDGDFDISATQKKLANPLLALTILFSFLLDTLFPAIFNRVKAITDSILNNIRSGLLPPLPRYLLAGKLII